MLLALTSSFSSRSATNTVKQTMNFEQSIHQKLWGILSVMFTVVGNRPDDTSSNPEGDCISHSANNLGKDMNPIIFFLAIGK